MSDNSKLRSYAVVTAAYWGFTLSDGALRMLVLGYFHQLGYSPFQLASLFILYELFGVLTNLIGGWIGSRTGLRFTLASGLLMQVVALLMLSGLSGSWNISIQVAWVISSQGLSGIAKDFTKLSAKSAIKTLVPDDHRGGLFRWVAILTGSKNTLKGVGFFLGGLLLGALGFQHALWALAAAIAAVFLLVTRVLPHNLGVSERRHKLGDALKNSRAITVLALARLFLFSARDIWFVVGLPVFLSEVFGWSFLQIGSYLALWVIGYGIVQAMTPKLMPKLGRGGHNDAKSAQVWALILAVVPLAIYVLLRLENSPKPVVLGGLAFFAVIFAINSAVHSYLVLAYADPERTTLNVGFYYMANATGRLLGTLLSGILYQWGGLNICLLGASLMVAMSSCIALLLPDTRKAASSS